jgi:TfoX/Sxy family transcriptional regulator of competence genes
MPYNTEIEDRINKSIAGWKEIESKKMFGGICTLVRGNMFCGVYRDFLILRLGEEDARELLRSGRARPFDITGRPMSGWVMMEQSSFPDGEALAELLDMAARHARSLPPKEKRSSGKSKRVKKA